MKQRSAANREEEKTSASEQAPALPAWKAFVVQFTSDAGPQGAVFAGRVEHLSSGRRERFAAREELLQVLDRLLGEIETVE